MPKEPELKARDKVVVRMKREGAVEENLTAGTEQRVSKRLEDAELVKPVETAVPSEALSPEEQKKVQMRRQQRQFQVEHAEDNDTQPPSETSVTEEKRAENPPQNVPEPLPSSETPFKPPVLEQHGVSSHTGTVIAETVVMHKLRKTSVVEAVDANVAQNSVAPDHDRLTFADGYVLDAPCRSSFDATMALVGEHGGVKTHQTLPKDADALTEVLSKQKSRRDRLPDAERTEALSPLPVAELRKYEAVKKAHPDALVCFAQNGYFELYGKDAEKAAPLLGTKLLEKKVRGKPSMPVTGFREAAWVAGSHKLWKSGADVFLSKDGETFKELKAADYIPVGATLNVDGIKCRIDAVDFAADEVRLTNIEDKNRPIRFSESIQYVRSYVEDAGTAIYDTIPKKPAARESIRDKLKSAQKAQPTHTPKPQKSKGKDMVL